MRQKPASTGQGDREKSPISPKAYSRDARTHTTRADDGNNLLMQQQASDALLRDDASSSSLQSDESLREVSQRQWQRGHDNARALGRFRAESASDSRVPLSSIPAQVQTAPEEVEPVLPHCSQQAAGHTGVDSGTSSRPTGKRRAVILASAETSPEPEREEELWEIMAIPAVMNPAGHQGSAPHMVSEHQALLSETPSGEGPSRPRKRRVFRRRPSPPAPTESDEEEAMWKILAEAG